MTSTSTQDDGEQDLSTSFVLISRLLFPILCIVLAVLYVEDTYADLEWRSLRYPYFVGALLTIMVASIIAEEAREIIQTKYTGTLTNDLRNIWDEWNKSIGLAVLMIVYILLIEVIGFIMSSIAIMLAIMYLAGERNWKIMIIITAVFLTCIYLLFVYGLNLTPPEGPLGI